MNSFARFGMAISKKCQDGEGDSLRGATVLSSDGVTSRCRSYCFYDAAKTDCDSEGKDNFCAGGCIDNEASTLAGPDLEGEDSFRREEIMW